MKCICGYLVVISCAIIFNSCDFLVPHDPKPISHTVNEIHIIRDDDSGYETIAQGYNFRILTNKNQILFFKDGLSSIKFDGTDLKRLTDKYPAWSYGISPDETKLVYSDSHDTIYNIYIMDLEEGVQRKLTNFTNSSAQQPQFSPDSKHILFRAGHDIARINVSGDGLKLIKLHGEYTTLTNPIYYMDNNIIYFEKAMRSNGWNALRLYNLTTQTDTILNFFRNNPYYEMDFYPKGKLLFIENNFYTSMLLRIFDIPEGNEVTIDSVTSAFFSPDGSEVIYTNARNIYIIKTDGTDKKLVYTEQDKKKYISRAMFSPNKQLIVFETSYTYYE